MTVPVRLGVFAAGVAALSAAAALAGWASGIDTETPRDEAHGGEMPAAERAVGLSDTAAGVRLTLSPTTVEAGAQALLGVALEDDDGRAVTDLDETHDEPPLHLILVRRDLGGYLHLHPERDGDRFSVETALAEPGLWRAYADFERDGEKVVLGRDVLVPGPVAAAAPLEPTSSARTAGYDVELDAGALRAGTEATLAFRITRGGAAVDPEPYLGADGHLVAVREDDLAYLHVHPTEDAEPEGIAFDAELADPGRYALFLQFKHRGAVRTVRFVVEVAP